MTEDRKTYIGGSSVAVIMCGELYERNSTDLCRWYQGRLELPEPTGPDIERGRRMERDLFVMVAGDHYMPSDTFQQFKRGDGVTVPDYIGGTVDGIAFDMDSMRPKSIVELKCQRIRTLANWSNWGLPANHLWQVRLYMAVWNLDSAVVAALDYENWCPVYWNIPRDMELEALMLDECEQFWACVQAGDDWLVDSTVVEDLPRIGAEAVEATLWQERDLLEYRELTAEIDARKERLAEIKRDFEAQWPPEAKRIVSEHGTVSMSTRTTTTVDKKRLESGWPEVYEAVTETKVGKPSVSFRMKKGAGQ